MKRKTLAVLPLAVCAAFGSTAMADTITFKGQVVANTCVPTVEGIGENADITLNTVSTNLLPNVGSTAGDKAFRIDLSDCGTHSPHMAKTYFWQTTAVDGRVNKENGSGSGWHYQILPETGETQIDVGNSATVIASNSAADPGVDVSSGNGTLKYRVRYYRVDDLGPGTMEGKANYVIFSN